MEADASSSKLSRRGLIGAAGALLAGAATVKVANDLALSNVPHEVIVCWSGWKPQLHNTGMGAWYTAHLPVFAKEPGAEDRMARQHFVSFVQRKHPEPEYDPKPRVSGYWPGEDFLTLNLIQIEDSREALRAWHRDGWEETCDRVFADEKKRAADGLVAYLRTLEIAV